MSSRVGKGTWSWGTLLGLGAGVLLLGAGQSFAASGCVLGCNMVKKECIRSARVDKLACKVGCRETAAPGDLGSCMRGCTDTFRTTKREVCLPNHEACRGDCLPSGGTTPDGCLMHCGGDLATCARAVVTAGRTCVQGCRTDPDRLGCLSGCADIAEHDAGVCEDQFTGCVGDCGGGSPSGAFLETR